MESLPVADPSALFRTEQCNLRKWLASETFVTQFVSSFVDYETTTSAENVKKALREGEGRPNENVVFICLGLCQKEDEIKLKSSKRLRNPRRAAKNLLNELYPDIDSLLRRRVKITEVKDDCCALQNSKLPRGTSTANIKNLEYQLQELEKNTMSECISRHDVKKCMKAWTNFHDFVWKCQKNRKVSLPTDLLENARKRIAVEINGCHFYMVFRDLWRAFGKPEVLHKGSKGFKDVLDACETAYVNLERTFVEVPSRALPDPHKASDDPMKEAEFYQNSKIEILSEFKTCDEIKTPSLPSVEEIEKPPSFGQKESQSLKRRRVDVDDMSKELLRQEQKMKLLLQEKENCIAELESRQEELWAQKRRQEKTIREEILSRKAMKERLKEETNKLSETLIHLCAENAHLKSQVESLEDELIHLRKDKTQFIDEKETQDDELVGLRKERDELAGEKDHWATNFDLLREEKDKIAEEKESLFAQCSKANDEKALLLDHVKRLNKKIDDVELRHQVECNRLKDDVTATVAELKRQRDK